MKFNICVVGKKNTFIETSNALKLSLEELGHNVDKITFGKFPPIYIPNEVTIVVMGKAVKLPLSKDSLNIFFCMEQWNKNKVDIEGTRNQFNIIFDIFKENNKTYSKNSILCPIGWSPAFETNLTNIKSNNNFFLFGSGHPTYRNRWIQKNQNQIIYLRNGIFGIERDKLIMRSKINLMVRGFNSWLLPPLHMMLIICKKKFLMMDQHAEYYPYEPGKQFKIFDKFPQDCSYWLNNHEARREVELSVYEDVKENHKFTKYLEIALKKSGI